MTEIEYKHEHRCASIWLNRAEKKNAMTRTMWARLAECVAQAKQDKARVLVIRARGEAFCAGADLQELQAHIQDKNWMQSNHQQLQQLMEQLYHINIPSVAVIEGLCIGGGMGIASCCDFRLATHNASFALTPAKLGLSYSLNDTARILRIVGSARARELLLGSITWNATQALTFGFLHELHAVNTLEDALQKRIAALLSGSADAQARIKETLLAIEAGQHQENEISRERFELAFESEDFRAAALAFLEKRRANA
jgi:enoyl-CoA hydratase